MSEHILVYASTSVIPPAYANTQIADLVAISRNKNASRGVTGALLYSEKHFAQALEGVSSSVDELMDSIKMDPRHKDIVILHNSPITKRRFEGWSLGYRGPSVFVNQIIERSIYESGRSSRLGLRKLMSLMDEFAVLGRND